MQITGKIISKYLQQKITIYIRVLKTTFLLLKFILKVSIRLKLFLYRKPKSL